MSLSSLLHLGVNLSGTDDDWGAYDISFPCNWRGGNFIKIEVKSSAYLQAWAQSKLSNVQFSIRPTKAWNPVSGYEGAVKRQSDVYVFCLYTETDRSKADPLILDGWDFYVIPTSRLDAICGSQKTISLSGLIALKPIKTDYAGIKDAVIACVQDCS